MILITIIDNERKKMRRSKRANSTYIKKAIIYTIETPMTIGGPTDTPEKERERERDKKYQSDVE